MRSPLLIAALPGLLFAAPVAQAEVHFGPGVYIAGHDFSHRRYGSVHIQRVRRLPGPPGCRFVRHGFYRRGDGTPVSGPMEQCNPIARPH